MKVNIIKTYYYIDILFHNIWLYLDEILYPTYWGFEIPAAL